MKERKNRILMSNGTYRLGITHWDHVFVEERYGADWLGVARWKSVPLEEDMRRQLNWIVKAIVRREKAAAKRRRKERKNG